MHEVSANTSKYIKLFDFEASIHSSLKKLEKESLR